MPVWGQDLQQELSPALARTVAHTCDPPQAEVEGRLEFSRSGWKQTVSQNKSTAGSKTKVFVVYENGHNKGRATKP